MKAEEAKIMSLTNSKQLWSLLARIKNASLEGKYQINVHNISLEQSDGLIQLGYSVHPKDARDNSIISWK